jgi:predicted TIM-barrel fold metal-dependent hydrolase
MPDIHITNCHLHTFTARHTPDRFLHPALMWLLRQRASRRVILSVLRRFFGGGGDAEHYARYIEIGAVEKQREILDIVRSYYPPDARFVVLPMDMAQMKAGKVRAGIVAQHDELYGLSSDHKLHANVVPFAAVDPQRGLTAVVEMHRCVEKLGFRGVKLYPPLGHEATHKVLMDEVYPYCEERGLPVLSHCTRGGVYNRELGKATARAFARPQAMKPVLEAFPRLRLCLAHFGGVSDWENYLRRPLPPDDPKARAGNWLATILDMLRSEKYPNLYTDISFTIFYYERFMPALKVFLEDKRVRSRVLFGSDFYMSEGLEVGERDLSIKLRAEIGADAFREIAETNPARFLDGPSAPPPGAEAAVA